MLSPGIILSALLAAPVAPPGDLLTVAERSHWRATASYDEVLSLLEAIESRSPIARRAELGKTTEGRSIPLLVLANPPVQTAQEAKAGGRAVVFVFGNIHAGEVCGKEALLMLARELALEPDHPLLEELVIVIAPIYNADGNERMAPDNRPGQIGPDEMGVRANAQGLDLNRDYIKLESPEARALVKFLSRWDPHLTIDTHTTNGSEHGYALTYAAPLNPSGHPGPIGFVRDVMLPEVTRRLRPRGYETFFYGNFNEDRTAWRTYSALPRFGGPYRGLRGQMSILSEAYAYASFRDRVLATREFVRACLTFAAQNRRRITALHDQARRETTEAGRHPQPHEVVGLRHRPAAFAEPAVILAPRGEEPAALRTVHLGRFEPTLSVRRPFAYVMPPGLDAVVANLTAHGIAAEPFRGPAEVEAYTVVGMERSQEPFQGHRLVRLEVEARLERRTFPPGSTLVRTGQPLGTLAVYLLEPESEDGLAVWNFFDDWIAVGEVFPVYRLRAAEDLVNP